LDKAYPPLLGGLGVMIAGLAAGMLGIGTGVFKVTVLGATVGAIVGEKSSAN
jgi:hypothetical protein